MRVSLLPLTLLGCACAGCGGGPKGPVAEAAGRSSAQFSEHVDVSGTYDSATTHVTATGSGDFTNQSVLGVLNVNFRVGGTSGTLNVIIDGDRLFATSPLFTDTLPSSTLLFDLKKVAKPAASDFGPFATQAPVHTLELLRRSGTAVRIGSELLGGVAATHYRTTVAGSGYAPVDVWVGADGLVRAVSSVYASKNSRTAVTFTFSSYGETVSVSPPAVIDSFDATPEAVQSLKSGAP